MRALVTGAAGFIGANLARRVSAEGHETHLLVREQEDAWRLRPAFDARVHQADLRDRDAVMRVVKAVRPEWIFHCAVYGAYSWQRDAPRIVDTNVDGTAHLLDACLAEGFAAFVNTGSSSEYGFKAFAPSESDAPEPNSDYARAKLLATEYCARMARQRDARVVTLRLYSVYGPYEQPGRLMPALLTAARSGRLPPLAQPDTARDFVYVDDVCDAYLAAVSRPLDRPDAVFNVGTGTQTTLSALVKLVRSMYGVSAEPAWGSMPPRSWDTDVWRADITRIRAELGWTPRHTLREGLTEFSDWLSTYSAAQALYGRSCA
jgi:dolichol-phosphate mannosyltransferase